jgi:hypothetical protein
MAGDINRNSQEIELPRYIVEIEQENSTWLKLLI